MTTLTHLLKSIRPVISAASLLLLAFTLSACSAISLLPHPTPRPTETRPAPQDTGNGRSAIRGGTGSTSTDTAEEIPAAPPGDRATVLQITDGDTIDVLLDGRRHTVRYIGVNTPERDAPFYTEATDANAELVQDQTVILVKDVSETDQYGRLLRYVYLLDGTFVNAELLRRGFAQAVTFPPDVAHAAEFTDLQTAPATARLGLWADAAITPQPTALAATAPSTTLSISAINPNGSGNDEPDEWVEFRNDSNQPLQLQGWQLSDEAGHAYYFPHFLMQPGQTCRVYTNQQHPNWCGFTYGNAQPIWNNNGDCATILDSAGTIAAERCY